MGKVSELPKLFHPDFAVPGRKPVGPVVVDWNNPLSRGLVAVWIFRNKSALVREFTLNTLEGNAHFDPVEGLKLDGTGDAFRTTDRTLHSGEISIISSGVINNTGSAAQIVCSDDTTGGREFQFKKNPSNKLQFTSFVGGSPVGTSSAASLSAGSKQTYGCSFSKNGSGNVKIYIDGLNDGSGTNSGSLDNAGGPATLGARFSASSLSDEINGSLSYVFVWDRVVSPAEQLSIHKNPYQILKPATPSLFIVPAAGGAFTLTASSGSYTLSGTAASLTAQRTLSAASGSYALTGTDAAFISGYGLTAESGSFTYTGTAAGLTADRTIAGESGSFTLTGTAASLLAGRLVTASSGSYTLSGTDASLTYTPNSGAYTLVANSGAYIYSGTAASLIADRVLTGASGTYTLTGTSAALNHGYHLTAGSGAYNHTGTNIAFSLTRAISAESGSYTMTGTTATLTYDSVVVWSVQSNDSTTWSVQTNSSDTWTVQ